MRSIADDMLQSHRRVCRLRRNDHSVSLASSQVTSLRVRETGVAVIPVGASGKFGDRSSSK